jgi:site-specific recombinase XerD
MYWMGLVQKQCFNKGVSIYEVQRLLGHSSVQMTQRYAHLAPNTLADCAEIVSDLVH